MMDLQGYWRSVVVGCAFVWVVGGEIGFAQSGPVGCPAALAAQRTPCAPLALQIEALLGTPGVVRAHWGVKVMGLDGSPIYGMNERQLFQPASNAKLFTTATAMALLGGGTTFETKVVGKMSASDPKTIDGSLVLVGSGDGNLSGRDVPYVAPALRPKRQPGEMPPPKVDPMRYLQELADQIAARGIQVVTGDVVGDDQLFPWEPYPQDWAVDDLIWGYGAPVSALTVSDNQMTLTVGPGTAVGEAGTVLLEQSVPYYRVDWSTRTGATNGGSSVQVDRALGSKVLRVYGSIALHGPPDVEEVAIQDPAEYAAMVLKAMLEAKGIVVKGSAKTLHRELYEEEGFLAQGRVPLPAAGEAMSAAKQRRQFIGCVNDCDLRTHLGMTTLASHQSPPLREDVVVTNKVSQNLHAELILRQLGNALGDVGTTAQGARVVRSFLTTKVGIDGEDFVFFDGSGLSGHDLVTPRATAQLLQYAMAQPWFADWKKSLPVGGEDGSLASRFPKAPLAGHVFAKTGTLGEARALSGYLDCASGRTVIFSIMVGNHAPRSNADRDAMDKVVAAIAAAN